MELAALFAAGVAAPVEGTSEKGVVVAADAFAAVFAWAMGEGAVEDVHVVSPPEIAPIPVTPCVAPVRPNGVETSIEGGETDTAAPILQTIPVTKDDKIVVKTARKAPVSKAERAPSEASPVFPSEKPFARPGPMSPEPLPEAPEVKLLKEGAPTIPPDAPVPPQGRSVVVERNDADPEEKDVPKRMSDDPVAASATAEYGVSRPQACPVAVFAPDPSPTDRIVQDAPIASPPLRAEMSRTGKSPVSEESRPVSIPVQIPMDDPILEAAPDLDLPAPIVRVAPDPALLVAKVAPDICGALETLVARSVEPKGPARGATLPGARPSGIAPIEADPKPSLAAPKIDPKTKPDAQPLVFGLESDPAETLGTTFAETVATMIDASRVETDANGDAPPDESPERAPTPQAIGSTSARTVATEKPEAGPDRPLLDRHLIVRQVAERIESLVAARPKDGVTIHLEPRDLGTVTLVVKGVVSALDVQVTASDERVRKDLDASRPELVQALAPRGIELREWRVAHAPASSGGATNAGAGGERGSTPEERARPQNPGSSFAKASRPESPAARPVRRGRGVDLLV